MQEHSLGQFLTTHRPWLLVFLITGAGLWLVVCLGLWLLYGGLGATTGGEVASGILLGLTLVIVWYYADLTAGILRSSAEQARLTREMLAASQGMVETAREQAELSRQSVTAANQQAELTRQSVEVTREQFAAAQRPCVVLKWVRIPAGHAKVGDTDGWVARNIGPGLAVNVVYIESLTHAKPRITHLGALASGDGVPVPDNLHSKLEQDDMRTERYYLLAEPLEQDEWVLSVNVREFNKRIHIESGATIHRVSSWTRFTSPVSPNT